MDIIITSEKEREEIFNMYPALRPVWESDNNTYMLVAKESQIITGYLFVVRNTIKAPIGDFKEDFISIIQAFTPKVGVGSMLVQKVIEIAQQDDIMQIRAYCYIDNVAPHRLFLKNGFTISPVKSDDGTIVGSLVAKRLK